MVGMETENKVAGGEAVRRIARRAISGNRAVFDRLAEL